MRPSQVVRRGADYLERHGVASPMPTAEQLLMSVLAVDRARLYTRDAPLRPDEAKAFGRALCRRCSGVPTQHLTRTAGFRGLTLAVRPGVFVPRPETEVLVDIALDRVRDVDAPVVVDVGTGTGAIALALKRERPDAEVWAVDRAEDALALARENADAAGLDVRIEASDLLDGLDVAETGELDLVVSNPPYIEPGDVDALPVEVRADPPEALVGGVAVYRRLFAQAGPKLAARGSVVVEIADEAAVDVADAARRHGAVDVSVAVDLAGRDRVVAARWP
jgi:release factor glutamine methyltransferase